MGEITMQDAAASLRKMREEQHPVPEGSVVRFVSTATNGLKYHYAAIYAGGKWYLTGRNGEGYFGHQALTTEEFVELLAKRAITEAELAVTWEAI